jgi:hypothetical protein
MKDGMTRGNIVTVIYSVSIISIYVAEPSGSGGGFRL